MTGCFVPFASREGCKDIEDVGIWPARSAHLPTDGLVDPCGIE